MGTWDDCPAEVQSYIFGFLPPTERMKAQHVSHAMHQAYANSSLNSFRTARAAAPFKARVTFQQLTTSAAHLLSDTVSDSLKEAEASLLLRLEHFHIVKAAVDARLPASLVQQETGIAPRPGGGTIQDAFDLVYLEVIRCGQLHTSHHQAAASILKRVINGSPSPKAHKLAMEMATVSLFVV
jgi:hypothetical protein